MITSEWRIEQEKRTTSPQSKLQMGLHVSTASILYSRAEHIDESSTVTERQKDIQSVSQTLPDINERGKVLYIYMVQVGVVHTNYTIYLFC